MMPPWLLDLIRCPITLEKLEIAPVDFVERIRAAIRDGRLTNRMGVSVTYDIQSGLLNESKNWFYPVVDDIPMLVPDEAIACES